MIGTNIRIVNPGPRLYVWTRRARVIGPDLSHDLLERACGRLRYQHGMAAILCTGDPPTLLVATNRTIPHIRLADEDWELEVEDAGEESQKMAFADVDSREALALLVERALFATLARSGRYWSLDSPRIWYEQQPCQCSDSIQVYRRYEIGALPIDDEGIGIAVDVGTAFFTKDTLAYFFDSTVPVQERQRRKRWFEELTSRQVGQKGTLMYDRGESRGKCYFEQAPFDTTCATTGVIRVKGQTYTSLADYYQKVYPGLTIDENGPAIKVSFSGYDRPVWVAAERVVARVMNDDLPRSLQTADKFAPGRRRQILNDFWRGLGPKPLGHVAPGVAYTFWHPPAERVHSLPLVDLIFGQGQRLIAPTTCSIEAYKEHFRQRAEYLARAGCYYVPPTMSRLIHVAIPNEFDEAVGIQLGRDLVGFINKWTGCQVEYKLVRYDSLDDAIEKLRADGRNGVVTFVLNEEPTAYHDVAYNLDRWRVKRITTRTLRDEWKLLKQGARNKHTNTLDLQLGRRRWRDFIDKSALDLVQQMDAVPYRFDQAGPYEAILVIDVGHDRRHFALSLLVSRRSGKDEDYLTVSHVYPKPDHQHEEINATQLKDNLVKLINEVLSHRAAPLASLLVIRDGRFCGKETDGVDQAIAVLQERGKLTRDARVDLVDLRKDSSKPIRLWEVEGEGATNPLEGKLLELNAKTVVVTATGAATLTQSTADPYTLVANGRCTSLVEAGQATFIAAQLNFSSPTVAQRLPLPLKRTDEELSARSAQEIKRLR
jgi:hypothetical protein